MKKIYKRIAFVLCCALLMNLFACTQSTVIPDRPEREQTDWEQLPEEYVIKVPLSFYSSENESIVTEWRNLTVKDEQTRQEIIVEALLSGSETGLENPLDSLGLTVESVQISGDTANVDLTGSPDLASAVSARVLIGNTLIEACNVDYVNIYLNGVAMEYNNMLLGAIGSSETTPDQYLEEIKLKSERPSFPVSLNITLYFPDITGNYLLCETRSVEVTDFTSGTYKTVLRELLKGPRDTDTMQGIVSEINSELEDPFNTTEQLLTNVQNSDTVDEASTETNQTFLYRPQLRVFIDGTPTSAKLSEAAVVCSLMGIATKASGVYVQFNTPAATDKASNKDNEYHTRLEYRQFLGDKVTLFTKHEQFNKLSMEYQTVAQEKRQDVQTLMELLLEKTQGSSQKATVFPEEWTNEDILYAKISENIAVINLSKAAYEASVGLEEQQLRLILYSIVNTMTEIPEVKYVQLLFDGEAVEQWGSLALSSSFIRNVGIIYIQ